MATGKGKKKQDVLNYKAQERTLREQGPGRLYLLWGREDYLREQYLLELKKLCLPGGEDDFSYHRFDGAELDFQALADRHEQVPRGRGTGARPGHRRSAGLLHAGVHYGYGL